MHQERGEGEAPPAMPPSASMPPLRRQQKDHRSIIGNTATTSPDIVSPLPAVVPHPIFLPAAVTASNRRMKSDELRSATCLDTPGWKDIFGEGCDWYEEHYDSGCPTTDNWAGDMGPATSNCCFCQGQRSTAISSNPTQLFCVDTPGWEDIFGDGCNYYEEGDWCFLADDWAGDMGPATIHCCFCQGQSITNHATSSPNPSPSTSLKPSSFPSTPPPTNSFNPSSSPAISSDPTQSHFCVDTPNWVDRNGDGCDWYEKYGTPGCPYDYLKEGIIGSAS